METITDFVKRKLDESRHKWPGVAAGSGVPISTIRKISQGVIGNPGVNHVEALAKHFGYYDGLERAAVAEPDKAAA
jgi:hypothetical protein